MKNLLVHFSRGMVIMEQYDNRRPLILPPHTPVLLRENIDGSITIENVLRGHDGVTLSDNFKLNQFGLQVRNTGLIIRYDSDPIEIEGTNIQKEEEINKYFLDYNDRSYMDESASENYRLINNLPCDFYNKKAKEMSSSIFGDNQ